MEAAMNGETTTIEARVLEYTTNAMQDDFGDGAFASYDASYLELLAPLEHRGKRLTLFHNSPAPTGSIWRKTGARLCAIIATSSLANTSETLFVDALSNVREL
jgi:hypothetical protein